ncbi:MAG: rod shape-determining protein MreD [Alicyclobacillus sp.]|nr:rod shape-determining protein MreD [Alicyclobacillus sp.]
MRTLLAFVCLWVGLIIQATAFQIPPLSYVQPNFVVVILVLIALTRGPRTTLVLGVIVGLIQDINYSSFIGLNAFAYAFVGYFAAAVLTQFIQRNIAVTFIVGAVCTFVYDWLTYGMTRLFGVTYFGWRGVMSLSLEQMMVNGILLLILYPLCVRWFTRRDGRRYSETPGAE